MVVATGFFDGVHLGHRFVIEELVRAAKERSDQSLVITFWPHPRNVLQNGAESLRLLTSLSEKRQLLLDLGVDKVEVIPFTREFSRLTGEQYLREWVKNRYDGKAVIIGYDNKIGSDAVSFNDITTMAESLGLHLLHTSAVQDSGVEISSTKIREALSKGQIEKANSMLGYNYSLTGVVVSGNKIGRSLGFPTANMKLYEPLKQIPGNGVYFVEVETLGSKHYGMCNIGVRPTIGKDSSTVIETHILDFDETIYGLDIKIKFILKIREEVGFESLDSLKEQLKKDKELCQQSIQTKSL